MFLLWPFSNREVSGPFVLKINQPSKKAFCAFLSEDFFTFLSEDYFTFLSEDYFTFLYEDYFTFLSEDYFTFLSEDYLIFLSEDYFTFLSEDYFTILSVDLSSNLFEQIFVWTNILLFQLASSSVRFGRLAQMWFRLY